MDKSNQLGDIFQNVTKNQDDVRDPDISVSIIQALHVLIVNLVIIYPENIHNFCVQKFLYFVHQIN